MVRRVGFGTEEEEEQPHKLHVGRDKRIFGVMPVIERAKAERKRRKPRFTKRGEPLIPRDDTARGRARAKWIIVGFLSIWLGLWSIGIYTAFDAFLHASGAGAVFMMLWLGFAVVGWLVAVFLLLALLFGKEVIKKKTPSE